MQNRVDLEAFYLRLPIFLQHVACSVEGWRVQRRRYGNRFADLLLEAERRTYWSEEQIQSYRNRRLQQFVLHCAQTVPFYRDQFRELGISPQDIRTLEDLRQLPVLTRAVVQDRNSELASEAVPRRQRITTHTSGTTGGGLRFATTSRALQEQWAVWWRYRRWHGLQLGTWCATFGGRSVVPLAQARPPFWRYNYPGRQILFSAYHMSPGNLSAFAGELRRRKPPWLHGYPSLLALLAAYVLDSGTELGYKVKWITVGAESLLPQQSELIAQAFGVVPRQHYGMAEAVANISECELGALHVDEDFAAVEFVPNRDGSGYRVVGTNFTNLATPLLRYDVLDVATLGDSRCPCGRPGRAVASVDGRVEDYVVLQSGARLGRMDHIFKGLANIREAQIYQERPGEITLRIVRRSGYQAADESLLLREARKRVGEETRIHLQYVEGLERSASGKLRFVVSEIPGEQLVPRRP